MKRKPYYNQHHDLFLRRETLLAGGGDATDEAKVVRGKLNPTGVVERRNIFRNSLVAIVKTHHMEFCKGIGIDLTKEGEVKKFHPDFQVDKVPEVPITELPPKPDLEKVTFDILNPHSQP